MQNFEKTYQLPFPVEAVYAHWISNNTVIEPAARMEIEARVGGLYRLVMPGDITMQGEFSQVEANKALAYSWQWQGDDDEQTEVQVSFEANNEGTSVQITHSGFSTEESFANHANGWDSYIDGFTQHLVKELT